MKQAITNPYETSELLNQYIAFHYGANYFDVPNYPFACAQQCLAAMGERPKRRALDLGCAVGRTTFELAREFESVVGIDLSKQFIHAADALRQGNTLPYFLIDEGELGHTQEVNLTQCGLVQAATRTQFEVGNACELAPHLTHFDLIFAGNLIDRLSDPTAFLRDIKQRLNPGGILVLSSPYTLLEDYTPKARWIGGRIINGQPRTMLKGITAALAPEFKALRPPVDQPFVIRETARKYQHTIAQISYWERQG